MKRLALALVMLAASALPPGCAPVAAGPLDETRYCTVTPHRDKDGSISRRADVLAAFKRHHPCPSTGKTRGACPGWEMQHLIPLKCGGCDSVVNLYWVPSVLKSGPGYLPIDRWERKVYCSPRELVPMPARQRLHLENNE